VIEWEKLSEEARVARARRQINQGQAATQMGLAHSTPCRLEAGRTVKADGYLRDVQPGSSRGCQFTCSESIGGLSRIERGSLDSNGTGSPHKNPIPPRLSIEQKVQHVSVLHHIPLALSAHLARLLGRPFAPKRHKIIKRNCLGADEPLLEIAVDHPRRFRR